MNSKRLYILSLVTMALVGPYSLGSSALFAAVIWDESIQGDLLPETDPTVVIMAPGPNDIIGVVGGDPNDPLQDAYDAVTFAITLGQQWVGFELVHYDPNPPNQTSGFVIYEGVSSTTGVFLNGVAAAGNGTDLFASLNLGPFGPGNYTIGVREFQSPENQYTLRVVLVPEFAAGWVLWVVCLGIAPSRWRRRPLP